MIHAEGFSLMVYKCDDCEKTEIVWNSRDGVTPFGISCKACNGHNMYHDNWKSDTIAPEFGDELKMYPNMRIFVDASSVPKLMKKKATEYVNLYWEDQTSPMKNSLKNKYGASLSKGEAIEFFLSEWTKPGEPVIVTAKEYLSGEYT